MKPLTGMALLSAIATRTAAAWAEMYAKAYAEPPPRVWECKGIPYFMVPNGKGKLEGGSKITRTIAAADYQQEPVA